MKRLVTTFLLFLSTHGMAHTSFPDSGPCLTTHLREAIVINKQRRPLYSELSNGKSESITDGLILLERQMIVASHLFDRLAKKYHENQIPVFCQDMMPMSLTPDFQPRFSNGTPDRRDYLTPSSFIIKRDLRRGLREGGFQGLEHQAMKWYNVYAQEPRFNCLTRHFLESTIRSARLAVKYDQVARERGVRSPEKLMKRFLQMSFFAFGQAIALDRDAAELQAQGLPILCQDVPHIPFQASWPN